MKKTGGKISRRELLNKASPLGKVTLEGAGCTGCGLCALDCPTGALVFAPGDSADAYRLLFRHALCPACGRCVEACPEKCLHLERTLELEELNRPPAVLFEDELVRCPGCGRPSASRAMIDKIGAKLPAAGRAQLELCPECKIKAPLGRR